MFRCVGRHFELPRCLDMLVHLEETIMRGVVSLLCSMQDPLLVDAGKQAHYAPQPHVFSASLDIYMQ
jgi:hypothetical protein